MQKKKYASQNNQQIQTLAFFIISISSFACHAANRRNFPFSRISFIFQSFNQIFFITKSAFRRFFLFSRKDFSIWMCLFGDVLFLTLRYTRGKFAFFFISVKHDIHRQIYFYTCPRGSSWYYASNFDSYLNALGITIHRGKVNDCTKYIMWGPRSCR